MEKEIEILKAPFPYSGGKSRVAKIIWEKFGKVDNYIEPFCGSLAVLFANPNTCIETVNDKDCALTNFWRAVKNNPEEVAHYADDPVNELDLHAKHKYIISKLDDEFRNNIENDINFFDTKIAGYWVWGMSCSIGNNWLKPKGLKALPLLSSAGNGINRKNTNIYEYFQDIATRLKKVRIICGDWTKLISPSITYKNTSLPKNGITAIFLDPPYNQEGRSKIYNCEDNIFKNVEKYCKDNENVPNFKIALCGYEGDYDLPGWNSHSWQTQGGMSHLSKEITQGKINAKKEIIYFNF
ncbi:MAG: DNA adenine methylase [Chitinophagales bacterium]|nr:DNA adenine methylase [Chitinophagales bacterium]